MDPSTQRGRLNITVLRKCSMLPQILKIHNARFENGRSYKVCPLKFVLKEVVPSKIKLFLY